MDTNPMILPVLILLLLCICAGQSEGTQDVVLSGSVFQTFRRATLQQCRRLCVYSSRCLSVNWSSATRECQLNSEKKEIERVQVSRSNIYLSVKLNMAAQVHPCDSEPCSTNHMCIPVNTAKAHICVRNAAFIPQTTDERTTSAAPSSTLEVTATLTTAPISTFAPTAATISVAPPTTLEVTTTMSPSTTSVEAMTSPEATTSAPTVSTATTTCISCETDIDCVVPPGRTCFGGDCMCSIGYDMDETSVECRRLTECTSFGLEFTLHVDTVITGNNFASSPSKTAEECKQLCLNSITVCKSFETYRNACYFQNLTWFEVDAADHRVYKDADHYQRRCNW
ncbi:uncharacterized protein [Haliotis asinina]|uniref:uncharacterized protein n=1 Tax=Haliotis asinina TaxID=109174 RepID=UPI003531BA01